MSRDDMSKRIPLATPHAFDRRILIGAGGATALAALGGSIASTPAGATTPSRLASQISGSVTMWVYPLIGVGTEDQDLWSSIIEGFNGENPDVEVTVEVQPWDRRVEKLTTAMAVGHGPDVWYINIEDITNHAANDRLVPMGELLSEDVKSDYLPKALAALSYQDQLWAAPILLSVSGTAYNTDVFNAAGVTGELVTWDALRAAGPKFKEQDTYLLAFDATSPQDNFYPYVYQAGGQIFSDDGQAAFNSPEGVKALTFLVELFNNGFVPESAATAEAVPITESPLGRGEVAMGIEESGGIKQLADTWGEGVLKIGPPFKQTNQVTIGTVAGWALSSQAEDQEAAVAWIKYLISPEVMKKIDGATGYFAPRKSVGSVHGDDPILGKLEEFLPMVQPPPTHPLGREISQDVLRPELESALLNGKDPQQALDDAADRANELIAQQ